MSAWDHLDINPGEFFVAGGSYFQARLNDSPQDFGGAIGECIPARRLRIDLDDAGCAIEAEGDREWVQVGRLGRRWPTERELREHLYETEFSR